MIILLFNRLSFGEPTGDSTIRIVHNTDKIIDFYFDSSTTLQPYGEIKSSIIYLQPHSNVEMLE